MLATLAAVALIASADPVPKYQPPADLAARVGELLAARAAHRGFAGTVMVAHQGKPLFAAGYGLANRDHDIPNTVATKFRIGSITKQFTAACVLVLEQQGKLTLDDPVGKHLPDCPKAWAEVTLKQLLSHTAGVPEHVGLMIASGAAAQHHAPAKIIDRVKDKPLDFKPGEKWKYSNTGYILLGMVVEAAGGKKYDEFLREHVLAPAGMSESGVERTGQVLTDRARGYTRPDLEGQFVHMTVPYAAGAMYSTVGDLVKWDRALAGDAILTPTSKAVMTTVVKDGYALGVGIGRRFGRPFQSHGGGIPGFVTDLSRYPDDGLAVVVLSNSDDGRPGVTAGQLAAVAFGKPYVVPRPLTPANLTPADLDRLAGEYKDGDRVLRVGRSGDKLILTPGKETGVTYTPLSAERFAAATRTTEAEAVFAPADGKPATVTVRTTGSETTWRRAD